MTMRNLCLVAAVATLMSFVCLAKSEDGDGELKADAIKRTEKDIFEAPVALMAEGKLIDSGASWGHSGPWYEDVDGDGKKDLLVGDFSGFFRFYRNTGSNTQPVFAKMENLKAGGEDAKVPIY